MKSLNLKSELPSDSLICVCSSCKPFPTADYIYVIGTTPTTTRYVLFDGYFMMITTLLYLIAMVLLILQLKKIRRKHMHSKAEK